MKKIFISILILAGILILQPNSVFAQNEEGTTAGFDLEYDLQVPLGSYSENVNLFDYIKNLYTIAIAALIVLAVGTIIFAGFLWLTAVKPSNIAKARELLFGSLAGLAIGLFSYVLLYQINPQLTNLTFTQGLTTVSLGGDSEEKDCSCPGAEPDISDCGDDFEMEFLNNFTSFEYDPSNIILLLQKGMREDLAGWASALERLEIPKRTITSAFRDKIKQGCLSECTTLAAPPGSSPHEYGYAVDITVKDLTDQEYCNLITLATDHNFKLNQLVWKDINNKINSEEWYDEINCPNLPSDWKDFAEKWHFTWTKGSRINIDCISYD